MTNEELEQIRAAMRQEVVEAVAPLSADVAGIKAAQSAMGAKLNQVDGRLERLTERVDRMDAKLDRAAVRADDVMGSQVRMRLTLRLYERCKRMADAHS